MKSKKLETLKKLSLLAVTILMTLCAHTQSSKDSTTLPNNQLRIALQKIEVGKQCEHELRLQQKQNDLLYEKISVKDSIIYNYRSIQYDQARLIDNYKLGESNLYAQVENVESVNKKLNKKIKKQKTKTFITSLSGVIGIIAVILLK